MKNTLRLALVQCPAQSYEESGSFLKTVENNLQRATGYIAEAARQGADLVVFPELWSHSYAAPYPGAFDEPFAPSFAAERRAFVESAVSFDSAYGHTLQTSLRHSSSRRANHSSEPRHRKAAQHGLVDRPRRATAIDLSQGAYLLIFHGSVNGARRPFCHC